MGNKHTLFLKYSGPAVDGGQMDAYVAASSIIAFSNFIQEVGVECFGEKAKISTEIQAFNHGSFEIEFGLNLLSLAANLFGGLVAPAAFVEIIKNVFDIYEFLDKKPPTEITKVDNDSILIENAHGDTRIYKDCVFNIASNEAASAALNQFMVKPLEQDGVAQAILLDSKGKTIVDTDTIANDIYQPIAAQEPEYENTVTMALFIVAPSFKRDNKWRFNDGSVAFSADIQDDEFWEMVDSGDARFGKGDKLVVDLLISQTPSSNGYKTERVVKKVHEHTEYKQGKLF